MAPITLPLTVHHDGRAHEILIEADGPRPWGQVRGEVCAALGRAADTVLYYGVGPAQDEWPIGLPPLLAGCELSTEPARAVPERPPVILEVMAGPDAGRWVAVESGRITIGRGAGTQLRLTDTAVSLRHAELACDERGMVVRDLGSTNGVFVDGRAVAGAATVRTGTILRVGGSILRIRLAVDGGGVGSFRPDGAGYLVRAGVAAAPDPPALALPARPIEPAAPTRRAIPVVTAVVGAAVGAGLAIALRNLMFLAFAAMGPVTMIGTTMADRLRGRRSHRRELGDHHAALTRWADDVTAAADRFRRAAWQYFPSAAELVDQVERGGSRLWSRRPGDPGYLAAVTGSERLDMTGALAAVAGQPSGPDGRARTNAPDEIPAGRTRGPFPQISVADMPLIRHLGGVGGFVGRRGEVRWILAQLAATHSPTDLRIRLISPRTDLAPLARAPHTSADGADLVVVLDGAAAIASPEGSAALRAATGDRARPVGEQAGPAAVICLVDDSRDLPAGVIAAPPGTTALNADTFERICRGLGRLKDHSAAALPAAVDLAAITGPLPPGAITAGWCSPSATARFGLGAGGSVTTLDLAADGPHVLIAGTTGSGKSELLQTLITSWALAAPPSSTTMLLVDYKGGAAFGQLAALPHVVGLLTDLDPVLSARALISLRAEVRRREELVAAGVVPPRLIIVIDEFATLAVEVPEFLQGLVDIAQRGRSLGIHLVLATQRPAGVVTPAMRANISTRICLRVTDPAESIDVIGCPDAAAISPRTPGRAILATGTGRLAVQTARATGVLPPVLRVRRIDDDSAAGRGRGDDPRDGTPRGAVTHSGGTFASATLAAILAAHGDGPIPPAPWVPPLPTEIADTGDPQLLAVADLPERQCHGSVPVPSGSIVVCGPPGSGRTAALRRIAAAAAARGEEVLVIDGAGDLADLAAWPAVSTYLGRDDPALILRLLTVLTQRPADRVRHLVIDRYDLVSAEVEQTDFSTGSSLLTEVATRGDLRLAVSGPAQLRHGWLGGGIGTVIELAGPARPGRGELGGTEIQVVSGRPDLPDGAAQQFAAFPDPVIIRPLPTLVPSAALPAGAPERVPIGVGGDAAEPYAIDLASTDGAVIMTGPRRSGISTALATVIARGRAAGIPTWTIVDSPSIRAADGVFNVHDGIADLRTALARHSGPLLLAVDDATPDHPAADLFDTFLTHCERGQQLIIGARADDLTRARRGYLATALGYRRGLLLGQDAALGMLFDLRLPRRSGPIKPGRGVWVAGGGAQPVQVALP